MSAAPPTVAAREGRTSKFAWAVGLTVCHQLIVMCTGLWLTRYLLAEVGAGTLGWWAQATMLVGYFAVIDLGVSSLLPRELAAAVGRGSGAAEGAEIVARFSKFALYQLPAAALIGIACVFVLVRLDATTAAVSTAMFAVAVATFPLRVGSAVLAGLQDVRFVGGFQILVYLSGVAVTVGCVGAGMGVAGIALGWAVQTLAGVALVWFRVLRRHRPFMPSVRTVAACRVPGRMFADGGWAWMATVGVGLAATAELLVVGWFQPLSAVFQYTCTTKLAVICSPLVLTLCQSALPGLSELRASGDAVGIRRATAAYAQFILAASGFFGIVVLATNGWFIARWVGDAQYLGDTTTVLSVLGMNARHAVNVVAVVLFCVNRDRPLWRVTLCDGVLTLGATAAAVWVAGPTFAPLGSLLVCATFTLPALLSITRAEGSLVLRELLRVPALWAVGYAAVGVVAVAVARHSTARAPFSQVGLVGGVALAYVAFLVVVLRRTPLSAYLSGLRRR